MIRQAHRVASGQSWHEGRAAVQTTAPSSISATDQIAARRPSAGGNSDWASACSAALTELAGNCLPAISLASTRRTLVSSTAWRWPKAKVATAAAV